MHRITGIFFEERKLIKDKLFRFLSNEKEEKLLYLRKRPVCWLAIGFLLIISMFLVGRSYREVLYQGDTEQVYLEGKITDKQYKDSEYGGYWQVTLKRVRVLQQEDGHSSMSVFQGMENTGSRVFVFESGIKQTGDSEGLWSVPLSNAESNSGKTESLEGKYLCQISSSEHIDLKIGQQILLTGKYASWDAPTNPGQFDSGKYYCSQGILGQFKKCQIIKQGTYYSRVQEGMWQLRQKANYFLRQELGEDDGALISAMLLGEKSGLDEEDKNLYQRNGISHILAISGLHLMLLGMGVFQVLKMILGGGKRVAVSSIIIMSIYCVFTGNSISTIRATIMFALSLTAQLLGRSYDSLSALGVAAILQLFMNPYVLNNSGFLLSFLAVIGVTFIAPRLQELLGAKGKITKSLCVSISSSIATLPVLLCNYGTYPWYSVFLNLFILPAMSVLLFLAVVLVGMSLPTIVMFSPVLTAANWEDFKWKGSTLFLGEILQGKYVEKESFLLTGVLGWEDSFVVSGIKNIIIWGIKLILKYFEICCNIFEYSPFQDGYMGSPTAVQIIVYGVLIVIAISGLIKHSSFARKMILLSAISILTMHTNFGTEITMLDVGQGDAVVIRNNSGSIYISDCGSSSVSKVGKYRLLPFLKHKGYGKIKGIFISHLDQDHMNGIIELLEMAPEERIEISYLFLPESVLWIEEDAEIVEELQSLANQNNIRMVYLKQGDRIKDGQMEFYCLHPTSAKNQGYMEENRNNQSLVLLMKYRDFEMLLTGDVEKQGEVAILENIDQNGLFGNSTKNGYEETYGREKFNNIDVLKVAHHGSSGSSIEKFLETMNPKLSLISCGKDNSYGHPHEETLERLEAVGSEVMTTVESGAITLRIGKEIKVYEFRK